MRGFKKLHLSSWNNHFFEEILGSKLTFSFFNIDFLQQVFIIILSMCLVVLILGDLSLVWKHLYSVSILDSIHLTRLIGARGEERRFEILWSRGAQNLDPIYLEEKWELEVTIKAHICMYVCVYYSTIKWLSSLFVSSTLISIFQWHVAYLLSLSWWTSTDYYHYLHMSCHYFFFWLF